MAESRIDLSSPDLERLRKRMGDKSVWHKHIRRMVLRIVIFLEGKVIDKTPVGATNILRGSIFNDIRGSGGDLTGVIAAQAVHGEAVELGTDPHWPPPGALDMWAQRVLGDASLGFLVARKISKDGTEGQFMFRDTLDDDAPGKIPREQKKVADAIMREIGFR